MSLLPFSFADHLAMARCIFVHKNIFKTLRSRVMGTRTFQNEVISFNRLERSENIVCSSQHLMNFIFTSITSLKVFTCEAQDQRFNPSLVILTATTKLNQKSQGA